VTFEQQLKKKGIREMSTTNAAGGPQQQQQPKTNRLATAIAIGLFITPIAIYLYFRLLGFFVPDQKRCSTELLYWGLQRFTALKGSEGGIGKFFFGPGANGMVTGACRGTPAPWTSSIVVTVMGSLMVLSGWIASMIYYGNERRRKALPWVLLLIVIMIPHPIADRIDHISVLIRVIYYTLITLGYMIFAMKVLGPKIIKPAQTRKN
jgi:hypothetical protein